MSDEALLAAAKASIVAYGEKDWDTVGRVVTPGVVYRSGTSMRRVAAALVVVSWTAVSLSSAPEFDLVLTGGRVIDPETGLDAVRNVGVRGNTIAQISTERVEGSRTIDANGLVVAPGFIDLHYHAQAADGYRLPFTSASSITHGYRPSGVLPGLRRDRRGRAGVPPFWRKVCCISIRIS
jgi:hypothetical protein